MSFTQIFFMLLAVVSGMAIPIQAGINSQLARVLGGTFPAAMVSFTVGAVFLIALTSLTLREVPSLATIRATPLQIFLLGGVLGTLFVSTNAFLVPKIGAAVTIGFIIAGQLISAMLIDQFGLFGVNLREASFGRTLGLVMVLVGALMVRLL